MRSTAVTRRATTLVAVAAAVALALTGCGRSGADSTGGGTSSSPGITDSTVTLGVTTPLTGTTAGPGTCTVAGLKAYFGDVNAQGGVKFGDGKTRKVTIKAYDDAYDPQKSLANFQQMSDSVFIETSGLGTPTNRAFRQQAIKDKVPQVLVETGDPIFSDPKQSPYQLGAVPIYQNEGEAFGKLLASSGKDVTVAVLYQNDDYGKGYLEGLQDGIKGADNVKIVKQLTYEATDTSVDSQITQLAATKADVFFNAMSITPLAIAALQKAQSIGWKPSWFLPSNTSSPEAILKPGNAVNYPGVYSVSFAKAAASPAYANDPEVQKFLSDMKQYGDYKAAIPPAFPHCTWSYIIGEVLDKVFQKMTTPTRAEFMKELRTISDYQAPMMLPGTKVDTTDAGQPAISTVVVQKYNGSGYANADSY
jgi:ABC-type branched-subunit amino acid transport system substrate-binding protein